MKIIDKALNDKNQAVRYAAINNPNATDEHLNKGLKDEDEHVRLSARLHLNARAL